MDVDDVDGDMEDIDVDDVDDDMDDINVGIVDIDDDIKEFVTNKNEEQKEKFRSAFKNPNSYERIYVVLELIFSHFNPHKKFAICRLLTVNSARTELEFI